MTHYVSIRPRFDGKPGFQIFYPADGAYYTGGSTAAAAEAEAAKWNARLYESALAEAAISQVMADLRAAVDGGRYEAGKTYRSAWQWRRRGGDWCGSFKTRAGALAAAVRALAHNDYCALSRGDLADRIKAARREVEATAAPPPRAFAPPPRAS